MRRSGKRNLLLSVLSISTLVYVGLAITKPADVVVFLALYYISAMGQVIFFMLIWAMVNDTIGNNEYRNTNRHDGPSSRCTPSPARWAWRCSS